MDFSPLTVDKITVLDEGPMPVAIVDFSDGSQTVMREAHLKAIGKESAQAFLNEGFRSAGV